MYRKHTGQCTCHTHYDSRRYVVPVIPVIHTTTFEGMLYLSYILQISKVGSPRSCVYRVYNFISIVCAASFLVFQVYHDNQADQLESVLEGSAFDYI